MVSLLNKFSGMVEAQKRVYCEKKYFILFTALFFASAYALVFFTSIPGQSLESWLYSVNEYTKAFAVIASVLVSMILTTQVYVAGKYGFGFLKKRAGVGLIGSVFSSVIATACCSPFIWGVIGLTSTAFFVATNQSYFFILALAVLVASLYYSSKIIFCEECRVKVGIVK